MCDTTSAITRGVTSPLWRKWEPQKLQRCVGPSLYISTGAKISTECTGLDSLLRLKSTASPCHRRGTTTTIVPLHFWGDQAAPPGSGALGASYLLASPRRAAWRALRARQGREREPKKEDKRHVSGLRAFVQDSSLQPKRAHGARPRSEMEETRQTLVVLVGLPGAGACSEWQHTWWCAARRMRGGTHTHTAHQTILCHTSSKSTSTNEHCLCINAPLLSTARQIHARVAAGQPRLGQHQPGAAWRRGARSSSAGGGSGELSCWRGRVSTGNTR